MKTIGMIGGMSWESTVPYYRIINETVREKLGGFHSAKIILHSVDFSEIEILQNEGRWEESGVLLAKTAASLQQAGAEVLLLCTNTMHKVAPAIEQAVSIPFLHIADATARVIQQQGLSTIGLLGTRFTMEEDFYVGRLRSFGLKVIVPEKPDREIVHKVIFQELCLGKTLESSRAEFLRIIDRLVAAGAQGVILGCTEISMLVDPGRLAVPAFDTTRIHAEQAAQFSLGLNP